MHLPWASPEPSLTGAHRSSLATSDLTALGGCQFSFACAGAKPSAISRCTYRNHFVRFVQQSEPLGRAVAARPLLFPQTLTAESKATWNAVIHGGLNLEVSLWPSGHQQHVSYACPTLCVPAPLFPLELAISHVLGSRGSCDEAFAQGTMGFCLSGCDEVYEKQTNRCPIFTPERNTMQLKLLFAPWVLTQASQSRWAYWPVCQQKDEKRVTALHFGFSGRKCMSWFWSI